ncbi:tetratricopeptide repeat protein [bacterium]|nr:tetratricopeptide repeat protein [bacterium]
MLPNTRLLCLWPKLPAVAVLALLLAAALLSCEKSARMHYTAAQNAQGAGDWVTALSEYEAILAMQPGDAMATLGKGRALYELRRFEEAIPLFEAFLEDTKNDPATFKDERYDAEFYRDKCKQELGQEVPQNPANIPEPPMGE